MFALELVRGGRVSEGIGDAGESEEQERDEEFHGLSGEREASGERARESGERLKKMRRRRRKVEE